MPLVLFLLGLIFGSLANVVILRQNTGERIVKDRSRCFACGAKLSWLELIPVASFLVQGGRCRHCHSKISWRYPLVELLTGFLFLFFFLKWRGSYGTFADWPILAWWLLLGFFLVVLAAYDIRHHILPDAFSYLFIALAFAGDIFFKQITPTFFLLSFLPALFLLLLHLASQGRWMGLGDAKLMAGGGLFLGFPAILSALFFAFWLGSLFGLALIVLKKYSFKSEMPFGPFLILGMLLAFFFPNLLDPFLLFF
ncbi:MAG: prepilin peptidase [bacterium]|nr:prepilin peptidase [bacterium]